MRLLIFLRLRVRALGLACRASQISIVHHLNLALVLLLPYACDTLEQEKLKIFAHFLTGFLDTGAYVLAQSSDVAMKHLGIFANYP